MNIPIEIEINTLDYEAIWNYKKSGMNKINDKRPCVIILPLLALMYMDNAKTEMLIAIAWAERPEIEY